MLSEVGVVRWWEGVMYLMSPGHPTEMGLQLGKPDILVAGKGRGGMFLFLYLYEQSKILFFHGSNF